MYQIYTWRFYFLGLKSLSGASSNWIVYPFVCPFLFSCPLFHPAYIKSAIFKVWMMILLPRYIASAPDTVLNKNI